jgi:hypothetical protein
MLSQRFILSGITAEQLSFGTKDSQNIYREADFQIAVETIAVPSGTRYFRVAEDRLLKPSY